MRHAALAQPAERLTRNEKVSGSIPLGGSGPAPPHPTTFVDLWPFYAAFGATPPQTWLDTEMNPMSTTYPDGRALLATILRDERKPLCLASVLLMFWSAGEALVPAIIGATIDEAIAAKDVTLLGVWLTVLALCFAMLSFGYRFGSRIGNRTLNRQAHRLRGLVAGHVLDLRRTGAPGRMPGEVATAASSDSHVASTVIRQAVLGVASMCGLLVCAAYLLWANLRSEEHTSELQSRG